jgi:hypothetical protein
MDINVYYDMMDTEILLTLCEQEYRKYVMTAAWSDTICNRVDVLKNSIKEYTAKIMALKAMLRELYHDDYAEYC